MCERAPKHPAEAAKQTPKTHSSRQPFLDLCWPCIAILVVLLICGTGLYGSYSTLQHKGSGVLVLDIYQAANVLQLLPEEHQTVQTNAK